jgi:hypothetical protein
MSQLTAHQVVSRTVKGLDVFQLPKNDAKNIATSLVNVGKKNPKAIPSYEGDLEEFKVKLNAVNEAFRTGIFFHAQIGSEGGILNIRSQEKGSNKNTVLRFDLDWSSTEGGTGVGKIKFGDIEKKIYPHLTESVEKIELVDERAPLYKENINGMTKNQVSLTGPVSEKMLLAASSDKNAFSLRDELDRSNRVLSTENAFSR